MRKRIYENNLDNLYNDLGIIPSKRAKSRYQMKLNEFIRDSNFSSKLQLQTVPSHRKYGQDIHINLSKVEMNFVELPSVSDLIDCCIRNDIAMRGNEIISSEPKIENYTYAYETSDYLLALNKISAEIVRRPIAICMERKCDKTHG